MTNTVTCPKCATQFEPTAALTQSIREELSREYNKKWVETNKAKEEEFKLKEDNLQKQQQQLAQRLQQQEEELRQRLEKEKKVLSEEISIQLKKNMAEDYDGRLKHFQELINEKDEKIKLSKTIELEALHLREKLMSQEQDMEIKLKRSLLEEREKIHELLRREEDDRSKLKDQEYQMKLKELEKQLDDQRRLAEEMRRKAEQGSMQLQGEVQELALEALLRHSFPFDVVQEVGKGVKGADCIQLVRNSYGNECGKIIYESKRTKEFSQEWIEKLKADTRTLGADVAVIVTQAMPKEMECFGEKDGVWICTFSDVKALVHVLRDLIVKVHTASKSQENKGDKMTLLYHYLTSHEFAGQWNAIREGFMSMKISIQKERDQMEKLWKAREKQLEKVLLNAAHVRGSIEGIAGMEDAVNLDLAGDDNGYLLE